MNDTPPAGELLAYLYFLVAAARPGQFLDIRWGHPPRWLRKRLIPAQDIQAAAQLIASRAPSYDVYVGVALRDSDTHGGKRAITASRLLFIECDTADTESALAGFAYPPTLQIASGGPGHVHLYWRLDRPETPRAVEQANRRLAHQLGGDSGCLEIARVLRPPATINHQYLPPQPVSLLSYNPSRHYHLAHLIAGLPADVAPPASPSARAPQRRANVSDLERQLLAIPAAEYARVLTRREPNRAGKILCPFHAERSPSLQLYPDGSFYCFGSRCRRGGSIFDFAAHLWNIPPRQDGFIVLRDRLAAQFHLDSR